MSNLAQTVANQNKRLVDINSIYRFQLVGDDMIDLIDVQGQPAYDDPESRYIDPEDLEEYTSHLIAAELSCR